MRELQIKELLGFAIIERLRRGLSPEISSRQLYEFGVEVQNYLPSPCILDINRLRLVLFLDRYKMLLFMDSSNIFHLRNGVTKEDIHKNLLNTLDVDLAKAMNSPSALACIGIEKEVEVYA